MGRLGRFDKILDDLYYRSQITTPTGQRPILNFYYGLRFVSTRGTMSKIADPLDDHYRHLKHLPDSTLRDLARNDAAPRDYRKFATELLWVRKSPFVKHTDLQDFVLELEAEYDGISFEFPVQETEEGPGPLTSSVTTTTMFGQEPEVVDNDKTEDHVDQVPAVLPEHSGEVLKVVSPKKPRKQKSDAD